LQKKNEISRNKCETQLPKQNNIHNSNKSN
jgi:hypothetical protein